MKWRVLLLIWLLQFVNYLDRVNLSVAGPSMMRDLHISPGGFGLVLAAFTFGYAIMQIPGGWLADRFGARALLIGSPIAWSVFTGLTGLARAQSVLISLRVLFGAAEGASNGASFKLVGDWFPSEQRSVANALYLSALALGPAFVAPVAGWMLPRIGWSGMFFWFSLPGMVLAVLIWRLLPPPVAAAAAIATEPRAGLRTVMARPASWLLFAAYLSFNIAFWGYIGWMPSYLSMTRHIELKSLGLYASVPYLFGFGGLVLFGWLGSRLPAYRGLLVAALYLMAAAALYATFSADTLPRSVIGLSVAACFLYGGFGPVWAIVLDLTPPGGRGAFSGFVNCGGQIGGFIAPVVVGFLVKQTHSFSGGFIFMMAGLGLSAVGFVALQPTLVRVARRRA